VQYAGVISAPGKPSLSPIFQQAAFDHLDIAVKYQHWETDAAGLETRITGLRAPTVLGANVTIPYKEACVPLMDRNDGLVRKVGALNTIHNVDGELSGYNTDVAGFVGGLRDARFEAKGCTAAIAGAGGAARAVVVALAEHGADSVTVLNRTLERGQRLVAELREHCGDTKLRALSDTRRAWLEAAEEANLLVNCTSLGAAGTPDEERSPVPSDLIRPRTLVYDLVYKPAQTRLLLDARTAGALAINGLPMLLYQGAASFEIWTGKTAPIEVMRKVLTDAVSEAN
jgi:shikimate dehydrogenase